jgi:energy-coupling factor transporter ATP-binding protein EcfA2
VIQLERTPAPEVLFGEQVERLDLEAEAYFAEDTRATRQRRFQFNSDLLESDAVYAALLLTSGGQCCFCSVPDRQGAELAAHRFRPPQDAVAADGRTSRRHYWWLAFSWENLYLACGDCRMAQGSKFPTERRRARVGTLENLMEREQPYLIDPVGEDPEPHFVYLDSGEVVWLDERALITIETFDLNRPRLLAERRDWIDWTKAEIRQAAAMVASGRGGEFVDAFLRLYATDVPFAALRRQYFNQWVMFRQRKVERILEAVTDGQVELAEHAGSLLRVTNRTKVNLSRMLGPREGRISEPAVLELQPIKGVASVEMALSVPVDRPGPDDAAYGDGREIHVVEIRNFQGVERMQLQVAAGAGEGSWLMLLGENGAGKTAALKAIALTLMEPEERDSILGDARGVLRQGQKEGSVRVELTGARNIRELSFGTQGLRSSGSAAPALLAAYGATRLLPSDAEEARFTGGPHTGSLFDPRFPLSRPSEWLPDLSPEGFDAVARGLHTILPLGKGDEVRRHKSAGVVFDSPHGRFGLENLSDGYRTMAVLALDMMRLFLGRWGSLEAAEGIVLIDEIGAHLHPRWQMRVVSTLRTTFPRVQFIATTHDPLCLRGLEDGEVVVLHKLDGRLIVEQEGLPSVKALSVDQLLTSEHFGLFSTLDPQVEEEFERYYELLAAPELDLVEQSDLSLLRERLAEKRQLGQTRRERLALEAVDQHLAQERRAESASDLRVLPEAARRSVRELLDRAEAP